VRLCVVGDSPEVQRCAFTLVQQGHQVYWLLPPEALQMLPKGAAGLQEAPDLLPATCRSVVPVQTYHCEGIRLVCVNQECWQRPDLHTRLFTCLCLLQRDLPCAIFHAWGPLPIAYLTVYTARFLDVPAVVSSLSAEPEQPFLWDWVARQASAVIVPSRAERERLLTLGPLTPTQVHVLDPMQPQFGQALTTLYARLGAAHG
jgi:Glycosyltransferase Family 4